MSKDLVLVTGGTGYIAAFTILQLLREGYRVRTTVRSIDRAETARAMIKTGGGDPSQLSFAQTDLTSDLGWAEAAAGCRYVHHIASPFPTSLPKDKNELIGPARDGTLRVLRAARDAGVKRVVMTSSFAAIGYGHREQRVFNESDWTNVDSPGVGAYVKSKTLAERGAWEFIAREGGNLELVTVNPTAVMGPVLGPDYSTSIQLIRRLLRGDVPGVPQMSIGIVDVRDVADLHVKVMTHPKAKGQRYLAISGKFMSVKEISLVLRAGLGAAASRVPTRSIPNWVIRLAGLFDATIAQASSELGKAKDASAAKALALDWSPRPAEDSLIDTGKSLIQTNSLA